MSYIIPDSVVQFYTDLGISDNYDNSIYFGSVASKDAYFSGIPMLATATALSYNRSTKGSFRVELPMSTLIGAGYLRFKNTQFENKWFYAFVKNVEYVNNETTEVTFELDVIMTWMGVFQLGQCFIDRQHNDTDEIGDNIIEEGLETGEFVTNDSGCFYMIGSEYSTVGVLGDYDICVTSAVVEKEDSTEESPKFEATEGGTFGHMYSGISNRYFDLQDVTEVNSFLKRITKANKSDAITSIKMTPKSFKSELDVAPVTKTLFIAKVNENSDIDTYPASSVKNRKMYTYPYCFLQITDGESKGVDLRYEFFDTSVCNFEFQGITGGVSEINCYPTNYMGVEKNYYNQLVINDFPNCAYNIDAYEAWLAQHQNEKYFMNGVTATGTAIPFLQKAMHSGMDLATSTVSPSFLKPFNIAKSVGSTITGLADTSVEAGRAIAQNNDRKTLPPTISGNMTTGLGYAYGRKDFYFLRKSIKGQYAQTIDNYFTMFGYKQNKIGVPLNWYTSASLCNRPCFAYTKTIGCVVHGELPSDHASMIESIFNNGIRFWRSHVTVGDYDVNNAPA